MRGQRFELDLDPEEAYARSQGISEADVANSAPLPPGLNLIRDIVERPMVDDRESDIPAPPSLRNSSTGFPAHQKRTSRFKRTRGGDNADQGSSDAQAKPSSAQIPSRTPGTYLSKLSRASDAEKADIDAQTTQMIADMDPDELAEARSELMGDPSFAAIRRLLMRSSIDNDQGRTVLGDDPSAKEATSPQAAARSPVETAKEPATRSTAKKRVAFAEEDDKAAATRSNISRPADSANAARSVPMYASEYFKPISTSTNFHTPFYQKKYNQMELPKLPSTTSEQSETVKPTAASSTPTATVPKPSTALDLDSDTFLSDLHSTYYPDLPSDPSRLAWMAPIERDAADAPTSAPADRTPPGRLRFDFRGAVVSAARSARIPVTKGLHHHGREPGAAGYTLAELAIYAHSTNAGQRCFAYQLLGRVLYRLGTGAFRLDARLRTKRREEVEKKKEKKKEEKGEGETTGGGGGVVVVDDDDDLPPDDREQGLWREVRRGHVLQQMLAEAAREPGTGSESARVWALEAIWLWRKGGGKGLEDVGREDADGEVMGDAAAQILEEGLNPQF